MKKVLILLAAGLSRRFGKENKLLHEVDGLPLYRHTLDKLEGLRDRETEVLVMTNTPEIQAHCTARGIAWRASPEAERGIAHTLHEALEQSTGADAYVCFVADQPKLRRETIQNFLAACETGGKGLGCLCCGERRGNPVWFAAQYRGELLALTGDVGGRQVLERHPSDVLFYPAGREELEDIDLPLAICGNID